MLYRDYIGTKFPSSEQKATMIEFVVTLNPEPSTPLHGVGCLPLASPTGHLIHQRVYNFNLDSPSLPSLD